MNVLRNLLLCLIILGSMPEAISQSASRYLKEADEFFENGRFREALRYYKEGGNAETWNKDIRLRAAICMYEINDINGSIALLDGLEREVNTPATVFFYLARASQERNAFDQAIRHYKGFLRESKPSDPRREWVKDEILRCGFGTSAKYAEQIAYVENLGTSLNTFYDEFGPVPSPLYTDRLYFSSARSGSKGGLKDPNNIDDQKFGVYSADMYYSENQNGIWRAAQSLDVINSTRNDIIYGFSGDGQRLFYYTGEQATNGQLVVDTFSAERQTKLISTALGPFDPSIGDKDLQVVNDSIILFASKRPGGVGGYDLYFSIWRDNDWSKARNLGQNVNSFYDDSSPFLTRNGRTLYYSSNRLTSIGGLDIFSTTFVDSTMQWSKPGNLGIPINSAGDDAHFFVGPDGLTSFFSSNRKTGYGKRDIYAAYMKQSIQAHLTLSYPLSFIHVLPVEDTKSGQLTSTDPAKNNEVKEYFVGDLAFDHDLVLSPQNLKKLDVLSNLLLIYPTLKVDLICHDVTSGPTSFDLYFSIKKSEQVADYLVRKGVERERMYIKGCGAFYPRAVLQDGASPNPNLARLNKRIEVNIYGTESLPISIIHENPNLPTESANADAKDFRDSHNGLVFRVQIASVNQLFQNEIFNEIDDAMIQWDPLTRTYKYYIGMETSYASAQDLRNDLRTRGFGDAFIIAHLNGKLITSSDISMHAGEYPDLLLMERGE